MAIGELLPDFLWQLEHVQFDWSIKSVAKDPDESAIARPRRVCTGDGGKDWGQSFRNRPLGRIGS